MREAPKRKKGRVTQSHKTTIRQMCMQACDGERTYHSSMISSDVLERESTSEVGDSLLKSETDSAFEHAFSSTGLLVNIPRKQALGGFHEYQKLKTACIL